MMDRYTKGLLIGPITLDSSIQRYGFPLNKGDSIVLFLIRQCLDVDEPKEDFRDGTEHQDDHE